MTVIAALLGAIIGFGLFGWWGAIAGGCVAIVLTGAAIAAHA